MALLVSSEAEIEEWIRLFPSDKFLVPQNLQKLAKNKTQKELCAVSDFPP